MHPTSKITGDYGIDCGTLGKFSTIVEEIVKKNCFNDKAHFTECNGVVAGTTGSYSRGLRFASSSRDWLMSCMTLLTFQVNTDSVSQK
jgi:hypothetical protein